MIIDAIELDDLGQDSVEAFLNFEQRLRGALATSQEVDRRTNTDGDGYYTGSYSPERYYVSSILAFLDEYDLNLDVQDISELSGREFLAHFDELFNKINYARTRFKLRKNRSVIDGAGTPITIKASFRDEIHHHLDTIRKVVNANIPDENKRTAIQKRIAALASEIDRAKTTVDAAFGRLIDLSAVVGECANNLEPLVQKIERILTAIYKGVERVPLLPRRERMQLLPTSKDSKSDLDDDIPF